MFPSTSVINYLGHLLCPLLQVFLKLLKGLGEMAKALQVLSQNTTLVMKQDCLLIGMLLVELLHLWGVLRPEFQNHSCGTETIIGALSENCVYQSTILSAVWTGKIDFERRFKIQIFHSSWVLLLAYKPLPFSCALSARNVPLHRFFWNHPATTWSSLL